MFCPKCSDIDAYDTPVKLMLDEDENVMYCSGPDGDNPCGFHYDLARRQRFRYEDKPFLAFWVILCILTLFRVSCQKRVYYDELG